MSDKPDVVFEKAAQMCAVLPTHVRVRILSVLCKW
jgi:hypothetical protein